MKTVPSLTPTLESGCTIPYSPISIEHLLCVLAKDTATVFLLLEMRELQLISALMGKRRSLL